MFVPADPFIPACDYAQFSQSILNAISFVSEHDHIALLGVQPTYAATGFGYIEYEKKEKIDDLFRVARFHEKPSKKLAEEYIKQPAMLWNIGMFCARAKTFIDEFARMAPDIYKGVMAYERGEALYEDILSMSVDYAVIERSNNVCVLPVDFSWCDVGNVEVFLSIKDRFATQKQSNVIQVESSGNMVDVSNKMVALVGVDDLCVVETADALLITKKSEAEKVRGVIAQIKARNETEYL